MIKKILGVLTGLWCLGGIILTISAPAQSSKLQFIILAVVSGVACFLLLRKPPEKSLQRKENKAAKKLEWETKRKNALNSCEMKHINGLPIAENMICTITSSDDKFIFSSGSMNFELEKPKITDICIKTETEIQEHYISSAGGAVGGAMLFGALGAMIGGRTKKKVKRDIHSYLIITYQSPDVKYIGFEINGSWASARKFVDDFKEIASETTVNL